MITAGDEAIFGGEFCENIFFCDGERRRPTEHAVDTILKLDSECMLKPFSSLLSLQYSLLQTVVEACQKKRRCRFLSSPKTFGGDPCPGHRKFIEVAYKCRPSEYSRHNLIFSAFS